MNDERFEPKIVAFLCNWCSYRATDMAGTARFEYPPNVRAIRVMCSGRVDPTFVLKAFDLGADGVVIAGCHPGECHYVEQNFKTMRRHILLRHTLRRFGVEDERIRLIWASASEGLRISEIFHELVEEIRALGPLRWRSNWREGPDRPVAGPTIDEAATRAPAAGGGVDP